MENNHTTTVAEKKVTTVTTKLTFKEKETIQAKAMKAGLTVSQYIRNCALGKTLFSTLSAEEKLLLRNLDGCRGDIINFANALHGMKREKRQELFQSLPMMSEWYRQIIPITNAVTDFLNSIYGLYGGQYKKSKQIQQVEVTTNDNLMDNLNKKLKQPILDSYNKPLTERTTDINNTSNNIVR